MAMVGKQPISAYWWPLRGSRINHRGHPIASARPSLSHDHSSDRKKISHGMIRVEKENDEKKQRNPGFAFFFLPLNPVL